MQVYNININENKMETTSHGTEEFPVAIYETLLRKNILGFVDWHWHSELQFCFITSGTVRFTVNSFSADLEKGNGIFINSGIIHTSKPLTEDAAYVCIDASPSFISGFGGSIMEKNYIKPYIDNPSLLFEIFNNDKSQAILNYLHKIYSINKEKTFGYELETAALLTLCWKELLQNRLSSQRSDEVEVYARLKQILAYIHEHYSEKISLSDLADQVHLCPSECCRYFKKRMNRTIFEYITDYRLSQSTQSLINRPDMSISQIAYEYGFGSTSYYIDKFKNKTGSTPLAYRKAFQKSAKS